MGKWNQGRRMRNLIQLRDGMSDLAFKSQVDTPDIVEGAVSNKPFQTHSTPGTFNLVITTPIQYGPEARIVTKGDRGVKVNFSTYLTHGSTANMIAQYTIKRTDYTGALGTTDVAIFDAWYIPSCSEDRTYFCYDDTVLPDNDYGYSLYIRCMGPGSSFTINKMRLDVEEFAR